MNISLTKFGFQVEFPLGTPMVLVALQTTHGRKPISIHLPHQIYVQNLAELLRTNPDADEIHLMPITNECLTISRGELNETIAELNKHAVAASKGGL